MRILEQRFIFWTLCVSRNPRPKNRPAGTQGTCTVRTMGNEVLRNFLDTSGEAPAQSHCQSPLNSQAIPVECKPVVLQMAVDPQANLPTGRLFLFILKDAEGSINRSRLIRKQAWTSEQNECAEQLTRTQQGKT